MTDALVAFLKARLDEDERAARQAGDTFRQIGETGVIVATEGDRAEECASANWSGIAEHIVRQDPARTLREVEAARAVLDLYEEAGDRMDRAMSDADRVAYREARVEQRTLRKVLLREAAVHEAHPDYLEEWRP